MNLSCSSLSCRRTQETCVSGRKFANLARPQHIPAVNRLQARPRICKRSLISRAVAEKGGESESAVAESTGSEEKAEVQEAKSVHLLQAAKILLKSLQRSDPGCYAMQVPSEVVAEKSTETQDEVLPPECLGPRQYE